MVNLGSDPFLPPTLSDSPHPHKPPADLSRFFVITPISNPIRYSRRYELYKRFEKMCQSAGVQLITVEQAFGLRQYMVTTPSNRMHVQVQSIEELWHKENMINIGIKRAMEMGAREVAWIDSDCRPAMMPREWFEETWHALQHYEFVQMWENLIDLSLIHNPIGGPQKGFMANYIQHGAPSYEDFQAIKGQPEQYPYYGVGVFGRPGLAWAANVDTGINRVGGLIDYCILGAGDWYMAYALVGMLGTLVDGTQEGGDTGFRSSSAYHRKLQQWQVLCERWIKRDVGYVSGTVLHDFHGRKQLRRYSSRGDILVNNEYDPDKDVKYDSQGLLQLETWEPRQIKMRDQIRAYFRARNEDSTTGGEE